MFKCCLLQMQDSLRKQSDDSLMIITVSCAHPVHDIVVMQEGHALQQHHHVTFDLRRGQRALGIPDDLREVRQHEVEHQDEARAVRKDVLQLHHLRRKSQKEVLHPFRLQTLCSFL